MSFSSLLVGSLAMIGAIAVGIVAVFTLHTWRDRRRHRRAYEEALALFEARPRAKILSIGGTVRDCLGREHATDFELDCLGKIPARSVGLYGELLIGGYTREELVEIAKRRKEFEP